MLIRGETPIGSKRIVIEQLNNNLNSFSLESKSIWSQDPIPSNDDLTTFHSFIEKELDRGSF